MACPPYTRPSDAAPLSVAKELSETPMARIDSGIPVPLKIAQYFFPMLPFAGWPRGHPMSTKASVEMYLCAFHLGNGKPTRAWRTHITARSTLRQLSFVACRGMISAGKTRRRYSSYVRSSWGKPEDRHRSREDIAAAAPNGRSAEGWHEVFGLIDAQPKDLKWASLEAPVVAGS